MAFLRSVTTTIKTAIAASTVPAAFVLTSSQSSNLNPKPHNLSFLSISSSSLRPPTRFGLAKNLASPLSAVSMDAPSSDPKHTSQEDSVLPELLTEFMVDMKCEGCVNSVRNKLQTVNGVKNVEVDLGNQVVRVLGSSPVKTMIEALEQTGRNARLIGQGVPEDFLVSAAVAEFKGPNIFGVVRFAHVNMELVRVEANFSGLSPGKHGWTINEFGDLTRGAASTGKVYNPADQGSEKEPLGDLGTLEVDEKGEAFFVGVKQKLRVVDLIGRSVVVYETEDKSSNGGLTAAVIARSAGVGENYKKLCTCDGTIIWESSDKDFVTSKV
ncbi:copper chaperone for superoxide dismutase, chloroplastic/cytosolic [Manihot esculenta]|uniref:Uncharacterized protein n=1 Tax=Manihot esculenta TaxID=3983 RepID=A0ACB7I2N7_MANES|nr:copper chaperone for superoxide dismutase, chloroplastic/cytosolic [Manihot esculenta]KAG8659327.1 hypothetical protein MANES_02G028800v8 [Manihot esculenta]